MLNNKFFSCLFAIQIAVDMYANKLYLFLLVFDVISIMLSMRFSPIGHECKQYKMDARPKGMCVIINNKDFTSRRMSKWNGTDEDVRKLKSFFKQCEFEVKIFENQIQQDMLKELKQISLSDHRAYDCFVCFILSHGQHGSVFGTDGRPVSVAEIELFFSARQCSTLAKKPKLFFIQACQGGAPAQGVNVDKVDHEGSYECDVTCEFPVHEHADFLTVFATTPEHFAYRDPTNGSPFISTLINVMDRCRGWSLDDIFNKVRDDMDKCVGQKQIPETKSTLTKLVVLT
ncbi:caspase-3-like [Gigantopelta aegis]|uniref:caspase-3-like n=1 Tax=Gigantopelta aegis TaxID=1735272 RepID=UPI001B88B0AD|nr:caspase-3-like [Gigantopelta aegis]